MIGTDSYHVYIDLCCSDISYTDSRYSPLSIRNIDNLFHSELERMDRMDFNSEPLKAHYLGDGAIRIMRQFELEKERDLETTSRDIEGKDLSEEETSVFGDDTMLGIIAIPSYFTATDLLNFIGTSFMQYLTHIRILKSERQNRFLVLLKFNDIVKTAEFHYKFNGRRFNSMEPETCNVIYIKSIQLKNNNSDTSKQAKDSLIPFLMNDPFTSSPRMLYSIEDHTLELESHKTDEKLVELPSCPVCLERMDSSITGLLTIPCQHTFHCQCLSKWKDDTCPVCRYSNSFMNHRIMKHLLQLRNINSNSDNQYRGRNSADAFRAGNGELSQETCHLCNEQNNLWICLICGNVGCDRYAPGQHSLKHFVATGHCFAMEANTSRVWDYAGDNYVHRLVANEADGKLVELPEKTSSSAGLDFSAQGNGPFYKYNSLPTDPDKVDQVGFEYSQLLISQLASQREYYECLLEEQSSGNRRALKNSVQTNKVNGLESEIEELRKQLNMLNTSTVTALKSKISLKEVNIKEVTKKLQSSETLNEALSSKVEYLTQQNKELIERNQDLSDQVRDLLFYLDSREKFKNELNEVKEGTVVVQDNPNLEKLGTSSTRSLLKKKNKKKK